MPDVSVIVPASVVSDLRRIVHTDFSQQADGLAKASGDEAADIRDLIEEDARLMDCLGWDEPAEGECELRTTRPDYLRALISGYGEDALATLEHGLGGALERRVAIRRLHVCAQVLERMEGVA